MNVVIPVTLGTQKAYSVVNPVTGKWAYRSSGSTIYALSFEKATELVKKVVGYHEVPPAGFTGFGHVTVASTKPVEVKAVVNTTPVEKPEGDCDGDGSVKRRRTVGQARAWVKVCENNLARCIEGKIGGDKDKYAKSVETAKATLAECEAAEAGGIVADDNDNASN